MYLRLACNEYSHLFLEGELAKVIITRWRPDNEMLDILKLKMILAYAQAIHTSTANHCKH